MSLGEMVSTRSGPVCAHCNDTHRMTLGDAEVMCTFCPRPCQSCRAGGNGPYCERTPCACDCHAPSLDPRESFRVLENELDLQRERHADVLAERNRLRVENDLMRASIADARADMRGLERRHAALVEDRARIMGERDTLRQERDSAHKRVAELTIERDALLDGVAP